jgi:hypothetical protein
MIVPDEIRKCVVYVGYRTNTGDVELAGTAFFLTRDVEGTQKGFVYLITAKHVIQGIESMENFDGGIVLRVNFPDGNAYNIDTKVDQWLFHPDESEVDVAVLPHVKVDEPPQGGGILQSPDIGLLPMALCLTDEHKAKFDLSLGDDVFVVGLFYNHHGRKRNIPIVRVGNIVALPEEKIYTKIGFIDGYLVECRSTGGLSGSPVFVSFGTARHIGGDIQFASSRYGEYKLLGLMHGHWDSAVPESELSPDSVLWKRELVNMGIAIVVPIEKILEVISQPAIQAKEIEREKKIRGLDLDQSAN